MSAGSSPSSAPTSRADLLADQKKHPPHGTRRRGDAAPPVRAGITGSGPELLLLTFTAADLARERAAGVRLLTRAGIRPGTRVANALAGALVTPGSLLLGDVIDELGSLDVPLGFPDTPASAAAAWKLIDRVEPDALIVDRAGAERLFAAAPPQSRPWLEGIVWLRIAGHNDAPCPVADSVGFSGWQRQWFAVPEATSFAAAECTHGVLHPDVDTRLEVRTERGVESIGIGSLLVSPSGLDTTVERYDTTRRAELSPCTCACGATVRLTLV